MLMLCLSDTSLPSKFSHILISLACHPNELNRRKVKIKAVSANDLASLVS